MRGSFVAVAAALGLMAATASQSSAATANLDFSGPGVSGSVVITYGSGTDATYPNAYQVTGITGTFTDSNNGLNILDAKVGPLVPINHAVPEVDNLLAPNDFSKRGPFIGLPPDNHDYLSFDNLFWPAGSPQTASDYPFFGGPLDIYGLMFEVEGGYIVDLWSDGNFLGGPIVYGVAVVEGREARDYQFNSVALNVPEPTSISLLGIGAAGLLLRRRRRVA